MVQRKKCRSRQELSDEYLLAKFGFDTAENEPLKVCVGILEFGWNLEISFSISQENEFEPRGQRGCQIFPHARIARRFTRFSQPRGSVPGSQQPCQGSYYRHGARALLWATETTARWKLNPWRLLKLWKLNGSFSVVSKLMFASTSTWRHDERSK